MKIFIPNRYVLPDEIYKTGSGASLSVVNHAKALSQHCEVYLLSDKEEELEDNMFGVVPDYSNIDSSLAWFEEKQFDAIVMFGPNVQDLTFFRHVSPCPIVIRLSSCYGNKGSYLDSILKCYSLLRPFDVLAPKSEWCSQEIEKHVFDNTYIQTITNGVDIGNFYPREKVESKQQLAEKFNDDRFLSMPLIGFCSRFEPEKGAYSFLRVADQNPDMLFVVVGDHYTSVSHPENVIFVGRQSHVIMPVFYSALDVLCALSVYAYESCPSVILEGMACGVPIISTDFAGAPELLGNHEYLVPIEQFDDGILDLMGYVDPGKISQHLKKIRTANDTSEVIQKQISRINHLTWQEVSQKHLELIKCLNKKKAESMQSMQVSVNFATSFEQNAGLASQPIVFNYWGHLRGPFAREEFVGQEIDFEVGLGVHLSQMMHPNEVESVILGITKDKEKAHKVLQQVRNFSKMLIAP